MSAAKDNGQSATEKIFTVSMHRPRCWHGEKDNSVRIEVESDDSAWAIRDAISGLGEPREELLLAEVIVAALGGLDLDERSCGDEYIMGIDRKRRVVAMRKMLNGAKEIIKFFEDLDVACNKATGTTDAPRRVQP